MKIYIIIRIEKIWVEIKQKRKEEGNKLGFCLTTHIASCNYKQF